MRGDLLTRLTDDVVVLSELYGGLCKRSPSSSVAKPSCTDPVILSPHLIQLTALPIPSYHVLYKFFLSRLLKGGKDE